MREMVKRIAKIIITDVKVSTSGMVTSESAMAVASEILEEMREPTEAMLVAGRLPYPDRDPAEVWPDMIDAARK